MCLLGRSGGGVFRFFPTGAAGTVASAADERTMSKHLIGYRSATVVKASLLAALIFCMGNLVFCRRKKADQGRRAPYIFVWGALLYCERWEAQTFRNGPAVPCVISSHRPSRVRVKATGKQSLLVVLLVL